MNIQIILFIIYLYCDVIQSTKNTNEKDFNDIDNNFKFNLTNIGEEEIMQNIKQNIRINPGIVVTRKLKAKIFLVIKETKTGGKILYTYSICKNNKGKDCLSTYEWMEIILDAKQISPKTLFSNDCFQTTVYLTNDFTFVITPNFQTNDFNIVPTTIKGPFQKSYYEIIYTFYLINLQYTIRQRLIGTNISVNFCTSSSTIYL